ncbi:putative bifunctional diguanylate cyclase/phosphodiesterase [Methylobacterium sp. JK268]
MDETPPGEAAPAATARDGRNEAQIADLLRLARGRFRVSGAVLTLPGSAPVAATRAGSGEDLAGAARSLAPQALAGGGMLVVSDADRDPTGAAAAAMRARRLGFYAGVPLGEPAGAVLSLLGRRARPFGRADRADLDGIGRLAAALLRQRAETDALDRQRLLDRACAVAGIGVWECDLATQDLRWSDAVYDLFELPRADAVTRAEIVRHYAPASLAAMETARARAIAEGGEFSLDAEIVTARGNRRWMRLTGSVECDGPRRVRIFGTKQDITAERELWERTRFLAETDVLTGLANRGLFQARLERLDQEGEADVAALLLVDLDGFKPINDTFGHAAGDACLIEVANRLRGLCGEGDLVSRIGGDEFAVLLGPSTGADTSERVAGRILRALAVPMELGAHSFHLGASVGIARAEGCGSAELFVRADLALYAAKAAGKNTFRSFTPEMRSSGDRQAAAAAEAAAALGDKRIALLYEPRLRLGDGGFVSFAAVARLGGPSGADPLAAAASEPALSARIAAWILDGALQQAQLWARAGHRNARVALPACAPQLRAPRFAEDLAGRLGRQGLQPGAIEIEVAEDLFHKGDPGPIREVLARLRACGIRVVLDASASVAGVLGRLRSDPVDAVKLDRTLVGRFPASALDRAVLDAILRFCAGLSIDVIADGVETEAQREGLRALGCALGQGPLLGAPLPAPAAERWLARAARSPRVA